MNRITNRPTIALASIPRHNAWGVWQLTTSPRSNWVVASLAAMIALLAMPLAALAIDPLTADNPYIRPGAPALAGEAYFVGPVPSDYHLLTSSIFPYNFVNGSLNEGFKGEVTSLIYQQSGTGSLAFAYKFDNIDPGNGVATDIGAVTIGDNSAPWGPFTITSGGSDGLAAR